MGFRILSTEQNRDDLIVKYNEFIGVIEIKGVIKSGAEKHAAQLEKWSALYYEKNGVNPKPILVVNAFKDTPLRDRIEPAFPNQMINYSIKREHCLITTLQLLTLYNGVLNGEIKKDEAIKSIFDCVGEYQLTIDWQKYITTK